MDRRQARQAAIHRGGLIIEAALNAGWWPDDLVDRHGDDGVGMIVEELTKIAASMTDNRRMPRLAAPEPATPQPATPGPAVRAAVAAAPGVELIDFGPMAGAIRKMAEQVSTAGVLTRMCFHPGGAPAHWKQDEGGQLHYWERRCERCGAWAQNRYTVPFLGPVLMPEQTSSATESNEKETTA